MGTEQSSSKNHKNHTLSSETNQEISSISHDEHRHRDDYQQQHLRRRYNMPTINANKPASEINKQPVNTWCNNCCDKFGILRILDTVTADRIVFDESSESSIEDNNNDIMNKINTSNQSKIGNKNMLNNSNNKSNRNSISRNSIRSSNSSNNSRYITHHHCQKQLKKEEEQEQQQELLEKSRCELTTPNKHQPLTLTPTPKSKNHHHQHNKEPKHHHEYKKAQTEEKIEINIMNSTTCGNKMTTTHTKNSLSPEKYSEHSNVYINKLSYFDESNNVSESESSKFSLSENNNDSMIYLEENKEKEDCFKSKTKTKNVKFLKQSKINIYWEEEEPKRQEQEEINSHNIKDNNQSKIHNNDNDDEYSLSLLPENSAHRLSAENKKARNLIVHSLPQYGGRNSIQSENLNRRISYSTQGEGMVNEEWFDESRQELEKQEDRSRKMMKKQGKKRILLVTNDEEDEEDDSSDFINTTGFENGKFIHNKHQQHQQQQYLERLQLNNHNSSELNNKFNPETFCEMEFPKFLEEEELLSKPSTIRKMDEE